MLIVAVNYAPNQSQCHAKLPRFGVGGSVKLTDLMSSEVYDRSRDDLDAKGLYLDLPGWGYNVFVLENS